jgi:thiosulfate reductase cytochrome b subunit
MERARKSKKARASVKELTVSHPMMGWMMGLGALGWVLVIYAARHHRRAARPAGAPGRRAQQSTAAGAGAFLSRTSAPLARGIAHRFI